MKLPLTERLRLEHGLALRLLASMQESLALPPRRAARTLKTVLDLLIPLMARHERLEESLLLPAFRAASPRAPGALDGYAHEEIRPLLRFIQQALSDEKLSASASAAVERLVFHLREHILEEERVLYPVIERALGPAKLMELDARAAELHIQPGRRKDGSRQFGTLCKRR